MPVVVRMFRDGHRIGNHGYSHARPGALSADAFKREIQRTDALIVRACRTAGLQPPSRIPVRLPYGLQDDDPRLPVLHAMGRRHVEWSAIADDWRCPPPSVRSLTASIQAHINRQCARGDHVLLCLHDALHDGSSRPTTVAAVEALLTHRRWQGATALQAYSR